MLYQMYPNNGNHFWLRLPEAGIDFSFLRKMEDDRKELP